MFDKTGDDNVNYREFIVGISPLITGDVETKLSFGLSLYDVDDTGFMRANEMVFALSAMNSTASYFGDAVMSAEQIDALVEEVYRAEKNKSGVLAYKEAAKSIAEHAIVVAFVSGAGTVRYGATK